MDFMEFFSNPQDPCKEIYFVVYNGIVQIPKFETRCLSLTASQIQQWVPTVLLFFHDFF